MSWIVSPSPCSARGRTSDYRPSRVTLATLTHIPDQSGYYQNRFDVMRLSLESLIAHSPPGTDVLVFDNGSCEPVVDYLRSLRDAGGIDYLLLSRRNVGKIGALIDGQRMRSRWRTWREQR